jgi:hypothetical protein
MQPKLWLNCLATLLEPLYQSRKESASEVFIVPQSSKDCLYRLAKPKGVTCQKGSHIHMGKCRGNRIQI